MRSRTSGARRGRRCKSCGLIGPVDCEGVGESALFDADQLSWPEVWRVAPGVLLDRLVGHEAPKDDGVDGIEGGIGLIGEPSSAPAVELACGLGMGPV